MGVAHRTVISSDKLNLFLYLTFIEMIIHNKLTEDDKAAIKGEKLHNLAMKRISHS